MHTTILVRHMVLSILTVHSSLPRSRLNIDLAAEVIKQHDDLRIAHRRLHLVQIV